MTWLPTTCLLATYLPRKDEVEGEVEGHPSFEKGEEEAGAEVSIPGNKFLSDANPVAKFALKPGNTTQLLGTQTKLVLSSTS